MLSILLSQSYSKCWIIVFQGEPKTGVPGEPIGVNELGTTVEVTFVANPDEELQIGTIRTKACEHPGKL